MTFALSSLTFDQKTNAMTFDGVRVLELRAFRHEPGDRLCLDDRGNFLDLASKDGTDPPGTDRIVILDSDMVMLRLDRKNDNWAILSWSKKAIKDLMIRVYLNRGDILPLRRATMSEKRMTIPIRLDVREKHPLLCKTNGCNKPCQDACSLCDRPLCAEHDIMCVALMTVGLRGHLVPTTMLGYCETCLYFLEPLPLEQEATT